MRRRIILLLIAACIGMLTGYAKSAPEQMKQTDAGGPIQDGQTNQVEKGVQEQTGTFEDYPVQPIPLQWTKVQGVQQGSEAEKLPADAEIVKEAAVDGMEGAKIVVFSQGQHSQYLQAALITGERIYMLGTVGSADYLGDDSIAIARITLFGQPVLRIALAAGASAAITNYWRFSETNEPKPLLMVDTGLARELDLDGDGQEEIVAESGLPMTTVIYRLGSGGMEMVNLNEAARAASVHIDEQSEAGPVIEVQRTLEDEVDSYKLRENQLFRK